MAITLVPDPVASSTTFANFMSYQLPCACCQAPAHSKPSAAIILASYLAYPFMNPCEGTTAVEVGQALAVASAGTHQGQVSFARCLSQGFTGAISNAVDCYRLGAPVDTNTALFVCPQ